MTLLEVFGPGFGILDIPRWLYIQFLTRNPNFRSKISKFYSQEGKCRKNQPDKFYQVGFSYFFPPGCKICLFLTLKFGFLVKNCIYSHLDMSRIRKSGPKMTTRKKGSNSSVYRILRPAHPLA